MENEKLFYVSEMHPVQTRIQSERSTPLFLNVLKAGGGSLRASLVRLVSILRQMQPNQ